MRRCEAFILAGTVILISPALAQNSAPTMSAPPTVSNVGSLQAPPAALRVPKDARLNAAANPTAQTPPPRAQSPVSPKAPAKLGTLPTKLATATPESAANLIRQYTGPKVEIDVDLTAQEMHVVMPDQTTRDWEISSGRMGLDTPDGTFSVQRLDERHKSKEYAGAPMPYAIFFDDQGHAIHGTYERGFGAAHSHGCIRLPVAKAKELFDRVKIAGAEINITGEVDPESVDDGAQGDPRDSEREYGYEPVDPTESDPSPWRDRWQQGSQWYDSSTAPARHARRAPATGVRPDADAVGSPWSDTESNY